MKPIESFVNQVIHGDCVAIMQSMPCESVDLVVTDPPYLVRYRPRDGRRCANDDNSTWLKPAFRELFRVLKPNSLCVSFYGWPWVDEFMTAWKQVGFRPVSHLTWVKEHCSRVGYTRSQHEVGFLLAKGKPPKPASPISDVLPWEYTGNTLHPNQKPEIGIVPLLRAYCLPSGIVLDPFAGSGSTAKAARQCGRQYILIEKEWAQFRIARAQLEIC